MGGGTVLKVAARHAVKDRHRSVAVLSAVALSIAVLTFALGFLLGMKQMFLALAFDTIGHICIQRQGYLEQASTLPVSLLVEDPQAALRSVRANPWVDAATEELVCGGMILGPDQSADALIRGVDTRDLRWNTRYRQALVLGRFPDAPGEILLGKPTAAYLKLNPGTRLTLMAYNSNGGVNAVEASVAGIFETDKTDENEFLVLASIELVRTLLQVQGASSSILVRLKDPESTGTMVAAFNASFSRAGLRAHPWKSIYAEVAVGLVWVNTVIVILFSIIVAVITFGIVNTHLISVFERIRILGTMRSIGMSRKALMAMVMTETGLVGLIGSLLGVALGAVAIRIVAIRGIDMGPELDGIARIIYPTFSGQIAVFCFCVGILVSLLGAFYPAHLAGKMQPLKALTFK